MYNIMQLYNITSFFIIDQQGIQNLKSFMQGKIVLEIVYLFLTQEVSQKSH